LEGRYRIDSLDFLVSRTLSQLGRLDISNFIDSVTD
jgi:hypothetical protein